MDGVFLTDVLLEVGHDLFMLLTGVFTAVTLFVVGLALYRLLPRRPRDVVDRRIGDRR